MPYRRVVVTGLAPELVEPVDRLFELMFSVIVDRFGGEKALVSVVRLCRVDLEAQRGRATEAVFLLGSISDVFLGDVSQNDLHSQRAKRLEKMLRTAD